MRLLLDAHVSGRRVGRALQWAGHDVRAIGEERELDGLADEDLLALAAADDRVLVTFDVADFPRILQRWAEEGRPHAGCAIVVGLDHREFGAIIDSICRAFAEVPEPESWRDHTRFVTRRRAP